MLLSAKYYWTIRAERGIYGMQRKEDGIMREGKKPMAVSEKYQVLPFGVGYQVVSMLESRK